MVGPHTVEQTKGRVVGQFKRLLIRGKRGDGQHGSEEFVLEQQVRTVHAGDHRRFHEGPVSVERLTTEHQFTAFFQTGFEFLKHFGSVAFVDQTAHSNTVLHARTDRPLSNFGTHGLNQFVVNVFVNQQSENRPSTSGRRS